MQLLSRVQKSGHVFKAMVRSEAALRHVRRSRSEGNAPNVAEPGFRGLVSELRKAGGERPLRQLLESEGGKNLTPFFPRWIND